MATIQLVIDKDPGSVATYITTFSNERKSLLLDADVDATITRPADANFAVIFYEPGKSVWVGEGVITIPVNPTAADAGGVLLKPTVDVTDVATLHFRSNDTAFVQVEFYR